MDNAARALIIAASILLGVMLFSSFVAMFKAGARVDQAYDEKQIENAQNKFNSKFEIYDKNDNTIMDIITICNAVYDVNEDYLYDNAKAIDVTLKIGDKYFTIPRDEPEGDFRKEFGRNKIFPLETNDIKNITKNPISIYKLADTILDQEPLRITGINDGKNSDTDEPTRPDYTTDKLSRTRLGRVLDRDNQGKIKKDDEGNNIYRNNVTIYKYVFVPKHVCNNSSHVNGISYNYSTGRVTSLEFEVQINPDWYE